MPARGAPRPAGRRPPAGIAILLAAGVWTGMAHGQEAAPRQPPRATAADGRVQPDSARAVDPRHLALARDVVISSGTARFLDDIVPAISEQLSKQAVSRPKLVRDLEDVLRGVRAEMDAQKPVMIERVAHIYAGTLSEPDLRAIDAFFRSPAGLHYVEAQGSIPDEIAGAVQEWTQDISQRMTERVRAEMAKRGHRFP